MVPCALGTPDQWQMVWNAVLRAAAHVNHMIDLDGRHLTSVMRDVAQNNTTGGLFHGYAVDGIGRLPFAAAKEPICVNGKNQNWDLDFLGLPTDVKTASTREVLTNKLHTRAPREEWLVLVVNYQVIDDLVTPFLLRYAILSPRDWEGGTGQRAELRRASFQRLYAPPIPDLRDLEQGPANIVKGIGPTTLAELGNPKTVRDLRRVLLTDRSRVSRSVHEALRYPDLAWNFAWHTWAPTVEQRAPITSLAARRAQAR